MGRVACGQLSAWRCHGWPGLWHNYTPESYAAAWRAFDAETTAAIQARTVTADERITAAQTHLRLRYAWRGRMDALAAEAAHRCDDARAARDLDVRTWADEGGL
jgi:hypothetical protein